MHKHAEILKALAEGKPIQWRNTIFHNEGQWKDLPQASRTSGDVFSSLIRGNENTSFKFRVKPEKKKGWINIYPNNNIGCSIHATKSEAEEWRVPGAIACIEIEYEEGQGL